MTNFDHIKGCLNATKAISKKAAQPVAEMQTKTNSNIGYLAGGVQKLKVAKNMLMTLSIGASGLFLSSCASNSMGAHNMVTRHGSEVVTVSYSVDGRTQIRAREYQEFDAYKAARTQTEYARANRENANAFKTVGQGIREWGKGIEAVHDAFRR